MRIKKTSETRPLSATVVNEYSDSQVNAYSTGYVNQAFGGTILWTNPNPTNSMAAQTTITLSSDDYDMYMIIFHTYGGSSIITGNSGMIPKGNGCMLMGAGYPGQGVSAWYRDIIYVDDTNFRTGTCRGITANSNYEDTTKNIPLYVIGYKTNLFN